MTKGFKQKLGVDYFENHSPVENMNFIRVVLSVVVENGYLAEQINTDTEFSTARSRTEYT